MFVQIKKDWELPESAVTPESIYLQRRTSVESSRFFPCCRFTALSVCSGSDGWLSIRAEFKLSTGSEIDQGRPGNRLQ